MAASDPTEIPAGVPDERVDALYGLPLDEFTPSRDALAKELQREGQRQQAAWVKVLRKPSAAAWVVNQLVRTKPQEAKRLLEAGEKLREVHERLLVGEASATELRNEADGENEAVRALLASAPGLLDRDGHEPSGSTVEKAEETLRAVAPDERARTEFVVGRLTRERRATGLGLFGQGMPVTDTPQAPASAKRHEGDRGARQRRAEQRAIARTALKEAKARQQTGRRAVRNAERELAQALREAGRAQRRLEQATRTLEQARADETEALASVADAEAAVDGTT
jgi:hypothetical protein